MGFGRNSNKQAYLNSTKSNESNLRSVSCKNSHKEIGVSPQPVRESPIVRKIMQRYPLKNQTSNLIVSEKAIPSERHKQNQQMRDVVFDDVVTPSWKQKGLGSQIDADQELLDRVVQKGISGYQSPSPDGNEVAFPDPTSPDMIQPGRYSPTGLRVPGKKNKTQSMKR